MIRPNLIRYIFYSALTGWVIGLFIHILSLANVDVAWYFPFVWLLHVLLFLIWLPMILFLRHKLKEQDTLNGSLPINGKSRFLAKGVFRHTPAWLRVFVFIVAAYAFLNFIFLTRTPPGTPVFENDEYVLKLRRGNEIRPVTESQYHSYRAEELRRFSGHWIFFYGMAVALLFPYRKRNAESATRPVY